MSDNEEETFGYSQTPTTAGFMYHADDDSLPMPIVSPVYPNKMWRTPRPVRRVSRVYLWEKKKRTETVVSRLLGRLVPRFALAPAHLLAPYVEPVWDKARGPIKQISDEIKQVAVVPLAIYWTTWLNYRIW